MSGPHVWYREDYQDVESYSYTLSAGDIQELASAVAEVQQRGIELKVHIAPVGSLICPAIASVLHTITILYLRAHTSRSHCFCILLTAFTVLQNVKQSDFKLPTLGPKLVGFRDEAVNGRGFVLLRGLPVEQWPVEEVAIAYWGLGAYWGKAQPQNRLHHLLGHVKVGQCVWPVLSLLCSAPAMLCSAL